MIPDRFHGLGRRHAPDPRDARFTFRKLQPKLGVFARIREWFKAQVTSKTWTTGPVLDQGETPQCVGYSWEGFLQAEPLMTMDGPTPQEIYDGAQQNDEWPGPPPAYNGSSVRGGAKALQLMGRIESYHWAESAADIRRYIQTQGPVVMGTMWYYDMFFPQNHNGYLKPTGELAGGHAWLVVGYDAKRRAFLMQNSWGPDWGTQGRAWVRFDDLDTLLKQSGEACAAVEAVPESYARKTNDNAIIRVKNKG